MSDERRVQLPQGAWLEDGWLVLKDEATHRTVHARLSAALRKPGPRIKDRCPCGKFSQMQALKRGHQCQAA